MPFCPNCRSEYRPGIETCADCGAPLVDELPERAQHRPGHEADVAVIRVPSRPIAEMWAELLGSNGIACRLVPTSLGSSIYATVDEGFEIRVSAIDAQRALGLLPHEPRTSETLDEAAVAKEDEELELFEEELRDAGAPIDRGLRWFVIVGVMVVIILFIALAARFSAERGYL
jgi:hypothetical protein